MTEPHTGPLLVVRSLPRHRLLVVVYRGLLGGNRSPIPIGGSANFPRSPRGADHLSALQIQSLVLLGEIGCGENPSRKVKTEVRVRVESERIILCGISVCGCLFFERIGLHFGRTMDKGSVYFHRSSLPSPLRSYHPCPLPTMASSPRLARILQLQRISNASRKFATATPILPPASPNTPTVLKSLPEHNPLLPLLLSHDIPLRVAQACADRFDTYANQLRSETETKLAQYLAYRCKNPPARVYSFYLKSYSQALRDWAQSILNAALKSLKRNSAEIQNWDTTYPAPLWLPVRLPPLRLLQLC